MFFLHLAHIFGCMVITPLLGKIFCGNYITAATKKGEQIIKCIRHTPWAR